MKIRERLSHIARGLGLATVAESLWTVDDISSPRSEDAGWIPLHGLTAGSQDIPDWKREQALRWSRVLSASHLAGRLLEIHADFVVGDSVEVRLRPKDRADAKLVDATNDLLTEWEESAGLDQEAYALIHDRGVIDGEQLLLIGTSDDRPGLDVLDPLAVSGYSVGALGRITSVTMPVSALQPGSQSAELQTLPVIRDGAWMGAYGDQPFGVVVHGRHRPAIHPRGVGMLFNVIDKLRLDDKFLEADLKRAIMAGSYFGQAKVTGPAKDVDKARELLGRNLPGFGSMLVTSDNVDISLRAAQMGLYEAKAGHEMAHRIIGLAAGVPLTWLGTGEDSNRASAVEMGSPTYRHLQRQQAAFRSLMQRLYGVVLDVLRSRGIVLVPADRYTIDVQLPQLSGRDLAEMSEAMQRLQLVLDTAVERGRLTNVTAQAIEIEGLQKLTDVELDPEVEGRPPEGDDLDQLDTDRRQAAATVTAATVAEAVGEVELN